MEKAEKVKLEAEREILRQQAEVLRAQRAARGKRVLVSEKERAEFRKAAYIEPPPPEPPKPWWKRLLGL